MYIETSNDPQKRKNQGSYNNGSKMKQNGHLFTQRKAIAITRVSTRYQCDSLEVQLNTITRYLTQHPELNLVKIHQLKESAYCLKPQELDNILENVEDGCAIIIMKVDRLTRNMEDYHVFSQMVKNHDIAFHFINEALIWDKNSTRDTTNQISQDINKAERESIDTSDRTKSCNEVCRSSGKITTPAPYGYINYAEGRVKGWKPHETESKYVKDLFDMYATGLYSIKSLISILNSKYHESVSEQHAQQILHHRFYIGWAQHDGTEYQHIYETFIDEATFAKCQTIAHHNKKEATSQKTLMSPLYKIVFDKQSGALFTPYRSRHNTCNYIKTKASSVNLHEKDIINGLDKALSKLSNQENITTLLHTKLNEECIQQVNILNTKIKITNEKIQNLNDRIINVTTSDLMSQDQITLSVAKLNKQIQGFTSMLNGYKEKKKALETSQIVISNDLVQTFHNMNIEVQSKMIHLLFSKIWYKNNSLTYQYQDYIQQSDVLHLI